MVYSDVPGMDGEKLSIVVAVYNIEQYLHKCVESLLAQTYSNLEIILVDDGATDGSGTICDDYAEKDSRVHVIHKTNGGLSDARNVGIEAATGTYLAFVDGDDWVDTDMYMCLIQELERTQSDIAVCRYRQIYRDATFDQSTGKVFVFEGKEALRAMLQEDEAIQIQNAAWNKLYRRAFLGEQRFPKGKWYEDVVYTTKLLYKAHRIVYLDSAKYNYVIDREGSIMNVGFNKRILTDLIPAYLEKADFLKQAGETELLDIHYYFYLKRLLLWYTQLSRSKEPGKGVYLQDIERRIMEMQPVDTKIFHWQGANPKEESKLKLFLRSKGIYLMAMWMNERILVPLKQVLRKIKH